MGLLMDGDEEEEGMSMGGKVISMGGEGMDANGQMYMVACREEVRLMQGRGWGGVGVRK